MITCIVIVFGLVIGSFLTVLIDRIPRGESVVWKPSHCDFCKKPLRWFELFPLLSFLAFRGRCLRCKKKLSWQYPFVESVTALGFVYLVFSGESPIFIGAFLVIYCLWIVLFGIDLKHQILPDELLLIQLAVTLFVGVFQTLDVRIMHSITAVSAGGFFLLIWFVTKKRGLGFGDVKLAFVLGLLLGYPGTIIALYVAFLTGAVTGVILMIGHKAKMKSRIAFGPFLFLGAMCTYMWGERIWEIWNRLLV